MLQEAKTIDFKGFQSIPTLTHFSPFPAIMLSQIAPVKRYLQENA